MPVPNTMADLATLASSNSPAGSEVIGNSLDDYIRAGFAIVRSTAAVSSTTIAAATTTNLASADGESVLVTGSGISISSLGAGYPGCVREVRFQAANTLVASTNLILPGALDITTIAGEAMVFRCLATSQWQLVGRVFQGGTVPANIVVQSGPSSSVVARSTAGINTSLASVDGLGVGFVGTTTSQPLGIFTNNARIAQFDVGGNMGLTGTYRSNGSVAGFFQESRNNSAQVWANYAFNNIWRLDIAGVSNDRITVDTSGNFTAAGNVTANSDETLKHNWQPLRGDLVECLAGLKAGAYERKDSGEWQVGVGAQSLEEFLPLAVSQNEHGIRSVAYGNAALVGVVALAKRLLALEAKQEGK